MGNSSRLAHTLDAAFFSMQMSGECEAKTLHCKQVDDDRLDMNQWPVLAIHYLSLFLLKSTAYRQEKMAADAQSLLTSVDTLMESRDLSARGEKRKKER